MKKAVIVGASSGMGCEVSKLLLARGWKIGVAARRESALSELKALNPEMVEMETIDIDAQDAPDRLSELIGRLGGIDLYFHAAGIGFRNHFLDPGIEEKTVLTNSLGFTRMLDKVFNIMSQNGGGHIAAISSIAGTKGLGPAPAYSATKAFQATYIQALEQLANTRGLPIRFTDIRPGFVNTALLSDGHHYPILMKPEKAAREIADAILSNRHVRVIDWRYRILTGLWQLIPRCLWRHMRLESK